MLTSHPMLMIDDSTAGASPVIGSSQWCEAHTGIDFTWDITPDDHIDGLEEGDYLVLLATSSSVDSQGAPIHADGWDFLVREAVSVAGSAQRGSVLGRFYAAAAPTQTFIIDENGTGTTCMTLYAFRGLSRRKPVEVVVDYSAPLRSSASSPEPYSIYFPPWRPHQAAAAAISVCFYSSTNGSDGPIVTPSQVNLLHDTDLWSFDHQTAGSGHIMSVVATHHTGRLSNLTGSYNDATESVLGFSTGDGITWTENATPLDYERMAFYGTGGSTHTWTHAAAPVSCLAGDIIMLGGCFTCSPNNTGPGDGEVGFAILTPSGDVLTRVMAPQPIDTHDAEFSGIPDYLAWCDSGLGGFTAFVGVVAPEDGDYTPKFYYLKQGQNIAYEAGGSSATSYILGRAPGTRYYGAGVAVNSVPFIEGTFAASAEQFSYGGYVPAMMILVPATSTYAVTNLNIYQTIIIELLGDDVDLTALPTRMEQEQSYNGLLWDSAAQLSLNTAVDQPRVSMTLGGGASGTHLRASTGVMPTYRTTEGGADTDGKYYFEITCHESDATADLSFAVRCNGSLWMAANTNVLDVGDNNTILTFRADGRVYDFAAILGDFGSIIAGDVFSIALDCKAVTCALYQNGVLLFTADGSGVTSDPTNLPWVSWNFVCALQHAFTFTWMDCTFNFTGPFTYAKPAGYVAWDWPNEVA